MGSVMERHVIRRLGFGLAGVLLVAAAPQALAPASGGWWHISDTAKDAPRYRLCLSDPVLLGQWEHRGARCTRTIVSDQGTKAVITYTCADGGFGRSELTLLTPRTIRVATQGISAGGPFNYVLHARRAGNCPPR